MFARKRNRKAKKKNNNKKTKSKAQKQQQQQETHPTSKDKKSSFASTNNNGIGVGVAVGVNERRRDHDVSSFSEQQQEQSAKIDFPFSPSTIHPNNNERPRISWSDSTAAINSSSNHSHNRNNRRNNNVVRNFQQSIRQTFNASIHSSLHESMFGGGTGVFLTEQPENDYLKEIPEWTLREIIVTVLACIVGEIIILGQDMDGWIDPNPTVTVKGLQFEFNEEEPNELSRLSACEKNDLKFLKKIRGWMSSCSTLDEIIPYIATILYRLTHSFFSNPLTDIPPFSSADFDYVNHRTRIPSLDLQYWRLVRR